MNNALEKRLKALRSTIMATAIKSRGWDYDTLHDLMLSWNYGPSLKKLSLGELADLLAIIRGEEQPNQFRYGIGTLDDQGRYVWSLMKEAGWDFFRLRCWMLKHCSASHWNALNQTEKRAVIAMLKNYLKPVAGGCQSSAGEASPDILVPAGVVGQDPPQ